MFIYKKSQVFHIWHSKSSCFGTLELQFFSLFVIRLHCDCPRRFDIVLFLRSSSDDMLIFSRFFIFFAIYEDHFLDPKYVILRSLSRKNPILECFFPLIDIVSNIDYPMFWYFERSCWDHYPAFYTTVLLKGVE